MLRNLVQLMFIVFVWVTFAMLVASTFILIMVKHEYGAATFTTIVSIFVFCIGRRATRTYSRRRKWSHL